MPNHCANRFTIVGSAEDITRFIQAAEGPCQSYKRTAREIERGVPPDEPKTFLLSFHRLVPIPDEIQAQEYDPAGYDAEHRLWGTKWGPWDIERIIESPERVTYTFTTAWGPGDQWHDTVAEKWPSLTFFLSYAEEYPSRGRSMWVKGSDKNDQHVSDYGNPPDWTGDPDDEDGRAEFYDTWENHYVVAHDAWVNEMLAR